MSSYTTVDGTNRGNSATVTTGLTEAAGDGRYVQLSGSTMSGLLTTNAGISTTNLSSGDGTLATPAIQVGQSTQGLYSNGTNVRVAVAGVLKMTFDTTNVINSIGITSSGALTGPAGTATGPTLRISGSLTTGIFSPSANALGITTNGVSRFVVDTTNVTTSLPLRLGTGSSLGSVRYGTATLAFSAASQYDQVAVSITFTPAFTSAPFVLVSHAGYTGVNARTAVTVSVSAATTGGATIAGMYLFTAAGFTENITVNWYAFSPNI